MAAVSMRSEGLMSMMQYTKLMQTVQGQRRLGAPPADRSHSQAGQTINLPLQVTAGDMFRTSPETVDYPLGLPEHPHDVRMSDHRKYRVRFICQPFTLPTHPMDCPA
ncbi:MAG: hypothetical protein R3C99_03355 [Pirellulaceae bacterium]